MVKGQQNKHYAQIESNRNGRNKMSLSQPTGNYEARRWPVPGVGTGRASSLQLYAYEHTESGDGGRRSVKQGAVQRIAYVVDLKKC